MTLGLGNEFDWDEEDEDLGDELAAGPDEATCIGCGCTESQACPGGCIWVTANTCSACVRAGIV